ncbi:MAG: fibronectin type III domain-containing protein [Spirochaetaceae bacterium]|jgi:hypothetical protein|nr:fibronectin type III domain-containing protein [Spirochaetaceae bacterium]
MKNQALAALFLLVLFAACPNPANNDDNNNNNNPPEQKTKVVFDNTQGVCAVAVYDDHQRRETDKITEIPAGSSSAEIEWTPSNSYPFYFTYLITLAGISDVVVPYVPAVGKDQVAIRIDEDKQTIVPVPTLEEALTSPDELLSGDSYIIIQNLSSYSFQLLKGGSSLKPDNSPDSAVVNSGEKALYKISPGTASVYSLRTGVDSMGLESFGRFEAGHIYRLYFDGDEAGLFAETEIKPENILPPASGGTVPETPGLPAAYAGDGLITISWLGLKDAETYEVYLSTTGTPPDTPDKTVPGHATVTIITGLTNKSVYTIWIKAANGYGASGYSPPVRCTPWPAMEPPQVPGGVEVIPGNGRLSLTWEAAAGASSYDVYISTSTTPPATPVTTTAETGAVIDGLSNGTIYSIWIKAQNSNGSSDYSGIEAGQPQQPTTPPAAPGQSEVIPGNGELTVKWQPVEMAESYEVWAGTSEDSADASKYGGDISGGTTQTVITGLVNETSYYVWVKAKNAAGTSGFSPGASAKPSSFAAAPAAPSTAPEVSPGDGRLTVTWTAVGGASGYELWIAGTDDSAAAEKSGGDISGTLTKTINGLTNGTVYYLWVKAKNTIGASSFSPGANGTPLGTPAVPEISPGNGRLTVTWTAVGGASAYEVWIAETDDSAAAEKSGGDISGTLTKTIDGLVNETTYYVWVKAKNSSGVSGFSPAANGAPSIIGNLSITVGFNYDEVSISGSDGVNGISKSGGAGRPQALSLSAAAYTDIVWYVDGNTAEGITDSGTGISLAAADYPVQTHSITFTGKRNGILYSRTIPFTVYD